MKKIILPAILLLISSINSYAAVGTKFILDSIEYKVTAEGAVNTIEVYGNKNYTRTSANIPDTVIYNSTPYLVTSIGNNVFYGEFNLSTVTLPSGLRSIGSDAFAGTALSSVVFPASLIKIGSGAFSYCSSLVSVDFSASTDLDSIGSRGFQYCTALTSIDMSPLVSLTVLSSQLFDNCTSLTTLVYPPHLNEIGFSAFLNCANLTNPDFPNSLTVIGNSAFQGCHALTTIIISASVSTIGRDAFFECDGMEQFIVDANNSVYTMQDSVLFNKNRTVLINFPNQKSIQYHIPAGVERIEVDAFSRRTRIQDVYVPKSLKIIDVSAFSSSSIESINLHQADSLIRIETLAFCYCGNLLHVGFPSSLTYIGIHAFLDCPNLTADFNFATSISWIGARAFGACLNLPVVTPIPPKLTSIESRTFWYCNNLNYVDFSKAKSLQEINGGAFGVCKLNSVDLKWNTLLHSIRTDAFIRDSLLSDVIIPASVTTINDGAFQDCISLRSFTNNRLIPQTINANVFKNVNISVCKLIIPCQSEQLYRAASVWQNFDIQCGYKITAEVKDSTMGNATGSGLFPENTQDTLIATPNLGYELAFWKDTLGNIVSYNDTIMLTITGDTTVIAYFRPEGTSSDASLWSLTPSAGVLNPVFKSDRYQYTDTVPYSVDSITFYVQTTDHLALVNATDTAQKALRVGNNSFSVRVTSSDGFETAEYFIQVYRLNNNAFLHELSVSNTNVSPAFDSAHYVYTDTVLFQVTHVNIDALLSDQKAKLTGDTGLQNLTVGWNNFSLLVHAEDPDTTRLYAINIYRKLEFEDTDARLISLVINNDEQLDAPTNSYDGHYEGECGQAQFHIHITIPNGATLSIENDFVHVMNRLAGTDTITFSITSRNGTVSSSHRMVLERRLPFLGYVLVLWNYNSLMLDIERVNADGLNIEYGTHYRWYKNEEEIRGALLPTYSAGPSSSDQLQNGAYYYLQIKTLEGEWVRTCASLITYANNADPIQINGISLYPNPVQVGQEFFLNVENNNTKQLINIYDVTGKCIQKLIANQNPVTIQIPEKGVYIIEINNMTWTKVIVE